jgi:hypothetical protein
MKEIPLEGEGIATDMSLVGVCGSGCRGRYELLDRWGYVLIQEAS